LAYVYDNISFIDLGHKKSHFQKNDCFEHVSNYNLIVYEI